MEWICRSDGLEFDRTLYPFLQQDDSAYMSNLLYLATKEPASHERSLNTQQGNNPGDQAPTPSDSPEFYVVTPYVHRVELPIDNVDDQLQPTQITSN